MQGPGSTVPELVLVTPSANSSLLLHCLTGASRMCCWTGACPRGGGACCCCNAWQGGCGMAVPAFTPQHCLVGPDTELQASRGRLCAFLIADQLFAARAATPWLLDDRVRNDTVDTRTTRFPVTEEGFQGTSHTFAPFLVRYRG